ncbi:UFM1 specific peptidase 1 isoform X2 [Oratosquilla oratoria]|uniref:UFM1 specific peptidase 1 isoform X2 n=1 Tax=Oratosquilla oratoria TaxID=337810 RepID=UPI003F77069B
MYVIHRTALVNKPSIVQRAFIRHFGCKYSSHYLDLFCMGGGKNYTSELLVSPHTCIDPPPDTSRVSLVQGDYLYYHYGCDAFDDRGWGCGYRTLMTLCSWVRLQQEQHGKPNIPPVPNIEQIQKTLVDLGDKPSSFASSREWIGSFEVCLILDELYGISSKIIHMNSGTELQNQVEMLHNHFENSGSPIMMGGDTDASSKGIMGIATGATKSYLLIVDPHFWGEGTDADELVSLDWIKWHALEDFSPSSFYNLCVPQLRFKKTKTCS